LTILGFCRKVDNESGQIQAEEYTNEEDTDDAAELAEEPVEELTEAE
jgi:hypothetical protein